MNEKKKFKINLHILILIPIVLVIAVVIIRLNNWNKQSTSVDLSDIAEGDYDMECNDYYVYPDPDAGPYENYIDNGVTDILLIGDHILNNNGEDHSILNILKENLDANIIDLTCEKVKLTTSYGEPDVGPNSFTLYSVVSALVNKDFKNMKLTYAVEGFASEERYDAYLDTIENLDLNEVDVVIIMYSMHDYLSTVPEMLSDEENVCGYHGALLSSIKLLQEKYPHLQIILSSPTPIYITGDDGSIKLGSTTDYGMGLETVYTVHQYAVATQLCISYIDNYYYKINESNITEYVDGVYLGDAGIDLIAQHMLDFLETANIG